MVRISICIFSFLILSCLPAKTQKDTLRRAWVGLDILPFAKSIYGSKENAVELFGSYRIGKNRYAVAEGGISSAKYDGSNFRYASAGWFARGGVDFNVLGRDKFPGNDQILIGLRYAYSSMHYRAEEVQIPAGYWPAMATEISQVSFGSHWLEARAGIRAEVFPHFFIGWSVAGRVLLYSGHPESMEPYVIPGFGNGTRKANAGFGYFVCLNF